VLVRFWIAALVFALFALTDFEIAVSCERRPPRRYIRDGQKAPASEAGRYKRV